MDRPAGIPTCIRSLDWPERHLCGVFLPRVPMIGEIIRVQHDGYDTHYGVLDFQERPGTCALLHAAWEEQHTWPSITVPAKYTGGER